MLPRLVVVKSHGVVWGNQTNKYIIKYSYNILLYLCFFMDIYVYVCRELEIPSFACTFMLKIAVASSKIHVRCWCILILMLYFMDVERCQGVLIDLLRHWPGDVNVHSVGKLKKVGKLLPSCGYVKETRRYRIYVRIFPCLVYKQVQSLSLSISFPLVSNSMS